MNTKTKIAGGLLILALGFASCNTEETANSQEATNATTKTKSTISLAIGDCGAVPGWGSQPSTTITSIDKTTGGGSATEKAVSNYADLKAAVENNSVKVIKVSGVITFPLKGRISFKNQVGKTIYGAPGAKLVSVDLTSSGSGIMYVSACDNIIIRNLKFEGPGAFDQDGNDNLTFDNTRNVWIDHCEFRDGMDGNLDFKNQSDLVSVTYCIFDYEKDPISGGSGGTNDHRFSNLIGSSDNDTQDIDKLRITFARCWWDEGCKERMPRVRFGKIHLINNYFSSTVSNKCVAAGKQSNIRLTSNVFEGVKNPVSLLGGQTAVTVESNNIFTNTTGDKGGTTAAAFTPPYKIVTLEAKNVKADIKANAGAKLTGNICGSF